MTVLLPLQKVCVLVACVVLPVLYRQITGMSVSSGIFEKRGTGSPYVKLLVISEGRKDELYDSCKFLGFSRPYKRREYKPDHGSAL